MSKKPKQKWFSKPEEDDYPAPKSYLSLLFDEQTAFNYSEALKQAPTVEFQAKDIFRASELPLLGVNNSHVKKDQKRIVAGKKLSPLLLVRGGSGGKLLIADGYHRLCAVYAFDENASIPCRLV
jgi:hypothetical protein